MKNKYYIFKLDADLDKRLKAFTEQLNEDEKIVSQNIDEKNNRLIVLVEQDTKKQKNLLLEQIKKGNMPNIFGK